MQKGIKKLLSVLIVFGMVVSTFTSSVTPTYGEDIKEQPTTAETPSTEEANQTTESNVPQKTDTSPSEQTTTEPQATTEVETTPQEEPTTQTATNEEDTNTTSNEEEKVSYPAQNFSKSAGKITVHVSAVEGIFPEGTTMTITPVSSTKATQIAKQTITGNEKVEDAIGVDITFYDSSGKEIEPKDGQGVQVNMQLNESLKGKDFTVVHQEDNGTVQTVSQNASAQGATFQANAFSIYVITGIGTEDEDPAVATYQFHDANGDVYSTQKVKNGEILTAPETPEKEGNIFKGWATSQGASEANFDITQPVSVEKTSTVDLYPVFSQKLYVFFLDKSGRVINTKEGAPGDVITTSDVSVPLGSEESVTGWYTDASLTNPVSEVTLEDHNVTLYPKIEKGHYLYFSTGDNASYIEPEFVAAGKQTQKPNDPTRPGYTFKGWSTTEGGSVNYHFGQTMSDNQTIYAVWSANTDTSYTVIYWKQSINDSKDATDSSKTYDYENSETRTGQTGDVVSPSYSDQNKNYTGFRYNASKSTSVSINGDGTTVLNVYYDRISMTINFRQRNTLLYTFTGLYGQTLKQNGYSWPSPGNGKCWQESDNTILTFLDAFIFDKLTHTTDGNGNQTLTLTKEDYSAVRTIHHYKQNLNGSYTTPTNSTQAGNGSFTFTNKYTGFTVSQYRLGSNGSWTNTSAGQSVPGSRQDLYVRYTRNSYELAFYNYNGISREESVLYEQSLSSFADYVPDRPLGIPDSFTFQGWYKDPELTQKFDFSTTMPSAGLTIYAKWAAPTYTATIHTTLNVDGVTIPIDVEYGDTINASLLPTVKDTDGNILSEGSSTVITIPKDTEWVGWATKDGSNYTTFNLNTKIYNDIELYPYYLSTKKYSVTYDANGGGGSVTDPKHYVNGTYADIQSGKGLTAPNKKSFLYWATDKNGSGTTYYPGDKIEVTGNMTLYAIYGDPAKTTSLTYHSNYPDGVELTKKQTINNSDELENNVSFKAYTNTEAGFAVPNGYYFDGWKDSSGKSIQAGETILVDNTSDNDLYAQWKKKKSLVIQVTGNEASHVYDGKSHSASGYTLSYTVDGKATSDLPSGLTLDESAAQAKAATGKKAGTYAMGLTAGDFEVTGNDLNKYSISIQVSDGHLLVTKRQVTLTSESATKKYDGKALTKPDVTVSGAGFVDDEVSNIKATGSITKVGSTTNTITYTENSGFDQDNYTIQINEGTLTITTNEDEITIRANHATKVYDGTPLSDKGFSVTGLPDGYTAEVTTSGSITDVGETNNVIQTVVIKDSNGNDVTDQFSNIIRKNGVLSVTKRQVTLTSESASKAYDGNPLTKPDVTVTGSFVDGEVSDIKAIGSITEVGNVANTITYTTHDGFKESNYEITKNEGTLTITPNTDKITVTAKSNEKTYDGKALSQDGYKVTGLPDGFTVKVTTEGSITDVGSTENKIASVKILKGDEDVTDQFSNIETKNGTLTVNPRKVTLTSESDSKTYDGTPLTNSKVTVYGDGFVEGEVSDIKATGSQMYVGSSDNDITYKKEKNFKDKNYIITLNKGKLTVTDKDVPSDLVVTKKHDSKTYKVGDTITFTIEVTNIYDKAKTITIVEQDDVQITGEKVFTNVAPGATVKTTATHVVTKEDVDAKEYKNVVTAKFDGGKDFDGHDKEDQFDRLEISKTVTSTPKDGQLYRNGETISYKITVKNTGTTVAKNVNVTDDLTGLNETVDELGAGEEKSFDTTYVVTDKDVHAGHIKNVATATSDGNDPVKDEVDTPVETAKPSLIVEKTSDKDHPVKLNETIHYTVTVTNNGNVTIENVTVDDELTDNHWKAGTLKPGESKTFDTQYTVKAEDIAKGKVVNVATADGRDSTGDKPDVTPGEVINETEKSQPHLTLTKTTTSTPQNKDGYTKGETITYRIKAENDGNVELRDIKVEDPLTKDIWSIESLQPGESKTWTTSYIVTEADQVKGSVVNDVTASAKTSTGDDPIIVPGHTSDKVLTPAKVTKETKNNDTTNTGVATFGGTYAAAMLAAAGLLMSLKRRRDDE